MRGQRRRDPPPSYADAHFPQLHFGWSILRSWRVGEWKYIDAPRPELYDLRSDRAEVRNVLGERSTVAARMGGELEALPIPKRSRGSAASLRRQRGTVGRAGRGADPKDKIGEVNVFRGLIGRRSTTSAPDGTTPRSRS